MHINFKKYYYDYLGINEKEFKNGKRVFSSEQRNKPLNYQYVYKLIATFLDKKLVVSVAPEFFDGFTNFVDSKRFEKLDDVIEISHDFFRYKLNNVKVRKMYRLILNTDIKRTYYNNRTVTLTKDILMNTLKDVTEKEKELIWKKRKDEIKEGRKFVVLDKGNIVAMAKISDVDFSGGNIAVYVRPNYRNKGYGKQVVNRCISWCIERKILPIYLVDIENKPSINLAKSLGFKIQSKEMIVSYTLK